MNSNTTESAVADSFAGLPYDESISTAFASIQENQMELSHMADSKANILITVSSILLTLAIAKIEQGVLIVPGIAFSVFCVPALIFATLCVMPAPATRVKPSTARKPTDRFNPLFFMHFTNLSLSRFEREIAAVISDPGHLYVSLTRDIYHAGMVLRAKKYRYLRWSYLCLMTGVVLGLLTLIYELLGRA